MSDSTRPSDVATYAGAVRSALADLPSTEAEVLLEDLEDHLGEVFADGEGSLVERLGPPERYAQELRAAYGAQMTVARPKAGAKETARRAIGWLTATAFYHELRTFLPQLRPAWWVLRAYLLVLIVTAALSPGYNLGPLPNLGTKRGLAEVLLTAVAIWLSVRLGRRSRRLAGLRGLVATWANVAIAVPALVVLAGMGTFPWGVVNNALAQQQQLTTGTSFSAGQVTNIYPYTQDGKPLTNVLLYDQDGRPVTLPSNGPDPITQYPMGADGQPITNAYPLKQQHPDGSSVVPPRPAIPPWPSPSPSPSPSASPTPSPTH